MCTVQQTGERGVLALFGKSIYYIQCLLRTNTFFAARIATQMRRSPSQKRSFTIFPITTTIRVCQQRRAIPQPHPAHTLWLYCSACHRTHAGVSCSIIRFLLICTMSWQSFSRFVSLFIGYFFCFSRVHVCSPRAYEEYSVSAVRTCNGRRHWRK